MFYSNIKLNYRQKSNLAEVCYLFVIGFLSPFAVGLQTWSQDTIQNSLGYVTVEMLQLPVIVLFYRLYLPKTIGHKRYFLFAILFPLYLILFDLNGRVAIGTVMKMPFIFESYRRNISGARPWDFTHGYFNTYIGYMVLELLAATSLYVIRLLFKNRDQLSTLETEKLKLELNQLKTQLQPHFFFNTINNMYALSVQNSPKTPQMITDLSSIMRYVLYDTRNEKVPLKQEVEFIESYIRLENLRHTKNNIVDFKIQGNIEDIEIAPLLFLPLIENTFKHALQQNIQDKWVKLVLAVDEKELTFQASNPKAAHNQVNSANNSGIGLANVIKRLDLLYPGKHELIIDDKSNVFSVNITILVKND